ncbi:FecR family protein [Carboxylicivirga marina]|uniref:FecR family protein n=1 Tax=Carboxylicivirga marina TaxID=2800988 RepID=UPI002594350C|nr:FecR family protein [uncultured Carboxylicivirga sp.]
MKKEDLHNEQWTNDDDLMKSLPKVELPYSRSKADVWKEMEAMMDDSSQTEKEMIQQPQAKVRSLRPVFMSVAALLIILLGTTAFFSLYTKTVNAQAGQHLTALLPDSSSIELNAGSVIKYKPFWWRFNREVQFEGEGFFKVQKGKSFEVVSSMGRTIVLGTSFNIYARKNEYKVTCYTGKVRVVSVVSGESTDITPNMLAYIKDNGRVLSEEEAQMSETISWLHDMFIFTGADIEDVFEEVERQYGVSIKLNEQMGYQYTGNFSRERSVDDVMYKICRGLGLDFEKTSYGYKVSK